MHVHALCDITRVFVYCVRVYMRVTCIYCLSCGRFVPYVTQSSKAVHSTKFAVSVMFIPLSCTRHGVATHAGHM